MSFSIVIPTRGRVGNQQTLASLTPILRNRTILVCPKDEVDQHCEFIQRKGYARDQIGPVVMGQPDGITTIAAKRHWIMQMCAKEGIEKVLMLDDDLYFYYRYWSPTARFWKHKEPVGDWRLLDSDEHHTTKWISDLMQRISPQIPHGGFGPRQGNDKTDGGWLIGGNRMMLALAYHVPTALANAEWGRIGTREDMDVAIQLLRKGLPNILTNDFVVGQKNYAAPGGMSLERTTESSDADAEKLAQLHPGFVRVVARAYKGNPRKEVVCSWKKAVVAGGYPKPLGVPRDACDPEGRPISGDRL